MSIMKFEEFKKEVSILEMSYLCYKQVSKVEQRTEEEYQSIILVQNSIRIVAEDICFKLGDVNKIFLYWVFSGEFGTKEENLNFSSGKNIPSDLKELYDVCCKSDKPDLEDWDSILESYVVPFDLNEVAKNILKNIPYETSYKVVSDLSKDFALKMIMTYQTKYLKD